MQKAAQFVPRRDKNKIEYWKRDPPSFYCKIKETALTVTHKPVFEAA